MQWIYWFYLEIDQIVDYPIQPRDWGIFKALYNRSVMYRRKQLIVIEDDDLPS